VCSSDLEPHFTSWLSVPSTPFSGPQLSSRNHRHHWQSILRAVHSTLAHLV